MTLNLCPQDLHMQDVVSLQDMFQTLDATDMSELPHSGHVLLLLRLFLEKIASQAMTPTYKTTNKLMLT